MTTVANIKQYEPRTSGWSKGQDSALPMQGGAEQSGQQSLGREKCVGTGRRMLGAWGAPDKQGEKQEARWRRGGAWESGSQKKEAEQGQL